MIKPIEPVDQRFCAMKFVDNMSNFFSLIR